MSAKSSVRRAGLVFGLSTWVVAAFIGAQFIAVVPFLVLAAMGIAIGNDAVEMTVFAALAYVLACVAAIGIPHLIKKESINRKLLGVQRPLSWLDLGIGLVAIVPYFILTAGFVWAVQSLAGGELNSEQALPFGNLRFGYEFIVAFFTLVVAAPIAEELLFRGYLLGAVSGVVKQWLAIILIALLFGALHLPGAITETGMTLQWLVAVDTFVLGTVMGTLRFATGSIWAGVVLHMVKNCLAFYFLFVSPLA